MRLARTITALAVISAALIALALPATAASASTLVLYGRGNGWHDPARAGRRSSSPGTPAARTCARCTGITGPPGMPTPPAG
jgi:hypothetical protein